MSKRLSAEQWTDYWQAGSVTTFMGRFANNYDGAILNFWKAVFDRQPDDANIVDLATGNGALAILASQYGDAMRNSFVVTAVDYAATDPKETLQGRGYSEILESITFLPNTRLEQTGLPEHSFDLVCSQFGFEYAAIPDAVVEIGRLLKSEGSVFAAMVHVEESAIVAQAQEGIRQVLQCGKSGLVAKAEKLLQALDAARENGIDPAEDAGCETLRASVNGVTGKLHAAQSQYKDPGQIAFFLSNIMTLFSQVKSGHLSLESKLEFLHKVPQQGEQYLQRMRDMVSSALSAKDIAALEKALEAEGISVESSGPIDFEGHHFCHTLLASR